MNIFGVGIPEIAVIFVLALLIFGPKKLPELGRSIGKTLKSLQKRGLTDGASRRPRGCHRRSLIVGCDP